MKSNTTVLAAEQQAVDRAYACYEAKLAELTGGGPARAAASGKDSIVTRAEAESRAQAYRLEGENLVVMRVDAQHDEAEPETFYIGRRSVLDSATSDPVVINWTSPLATAWRSAAPGSLAEIRLRRQLDCDERTVRGYRDEIAAPYPDEPADAEPGSTPARAEESQATAATADRPPRVPTPGELFPTARPPQPDELLRRELDRSRTGPMRDIVETIRPDQMTLVADTPTQVLVVQGGPGTGKSAVGLHRVTWLVDNGHFRAREILVVGPHRRFLDYVGRVLPTLGTRDVTAVELPLLWTGTVRAEEDRATRRVKSDERMAVLLRRRVEGNSRPAAIDAAMTTPAHEDEEPTLTIVLGSAPLRIPRSEVVGLFEDARGARGHYRARRDRFRDLLVDRLLAALQSGFPHRGRDRNVRRDIERHRAVITLVERVWPPLSAEEALRTLLNSASRLAECAEQVFTEEEQALLRRPAVERVEDEPWTLDDLVCLEELRILISGDSPPRYPHIVVDEAQDLTPMQARSLRRRSPQGSMTVLGDLAQATGPHGYTDWQQLGRLLAGKSGWQMAELTAGYRVPARIMEFVAPLARAVAPTVPFPVAVKESEGEAVRIVGSTPWALVDLAVTEAARHAGADADHHQRSIAVIVPDDSGWLQKVRQLVVETAEMADEVREAVTVLTAGEAKGMEFDHVIVLEPATIAAQGPEGPRRLYVALTRSTRTLTVLHSAALPEVLTPAPAADPAPVERTCTRYHADGRRCEQLASHPDGWCRTEGCGGFRTEEPLFTATGRTLPRIPDNADHDARVEPDGAWLARLRLTRSALQAFIGTHGGTLAEAEAEIRAVLPEILQHGRQAQQVDGYRLVDLDGYRFVISPEADAVTAYRTVHAERSYAQFKAGVPSRYGSNLAGTGPRVTEPAGLAAQGLTELKVSAAARSAFAALVPAPGTDLLDRLRATYREALDGGRITMADRGPHHVIRDGELTWGVTADGCTIVFVRRHTALDAQVYAAAGLPDVPALPVGTELRVRVLPHGDRRFWQVVPVEPDPDRRYVLQLRSSDPAPVPGSELDAWALATQHGVCLLSATDFGRSPVTEEAAARYADALAVLDEVAAGRTGEQTADRLGELAELADGCLRRRKADWLMLWQLLGEPSVEQLTALRDLAQDLLVTAPATGDAALPATDWLARLTSAVERLRAIAARSANMPPDPHPLLANLLAAATADRAEYTHEAVRYALLAALKKTGREPMESELIDIATTAGPRALYEALPAGHTGYAAVRAGAVRLREIDQMVGVGAEALFLVLPEPPEHPWIPDTVQQVLGVRVLWQSPAGWRGPGSTAVTGTG